MIETNISNHIGRILIDWLFRLFRQKILSIILNYNCEHCFCLMEFKSLDLRWTRFSKFFFSRKRLIVLAKDIANLDMSSKKKKKFPFKFIIICHFSSPKFIVALYLVISSQLFDFVLLGLLCLFVCIVKTYRTLLFVIGFDLVRFRFNRQLLQ